jgi:hypothetical protein
MLVAVSFSYRRVSEAGPSAVVKILGMRIGTCINACTNGRYAGKAGAVGTTVQTINSFSSRSRDVASTATQAVRRAGEGHLRSCLRHSGQLKHKCTKSIHCRADDPIPSQVDSSSGQRARACT